MTISIYFSRHLPSQSVPVNLHMRLFEQYIISSSQIPLEIPKKYVLHKSTNYMQILPLRHEKEQILFRFNILAQILYQISFQELKNHFSPSYKVLLLHLRFNLLIQSFLTKCHLLLPHVRFILLLQRFPMEIPSLHQYK